MLDFTRQKQPDDTEPDMTPLIDVVFILLLFFIIASAFAVRGLDIDLPPAQSSQALSGRVVELQLFADGRFMCDGVPVDRTEIRDRLQNIVRGFRQRSGQLVLKAAPNAPVEALIFLVDEVRLQGGETLHIATAPPERNSRNGTYAHDRH